MKNYWIVSLIIGLVLLFFFPEPETNFVIYVAVAVFFVVLTIILFKRGNNDK